MSSKSDASHTKQIQIAQYSHKLDSLKITKIKRKENSTNLQRTKTIYLP